MRTTMKTTLFLLAALCATSALAFEGHVVGVIDGDTLDVLDGQRRSHRIRLAEIDAPEKNQPFGQQAKRRLSDLCFDKPAVVREKERDQYGRTIGYVLCNRVDANLAMVSDGMAWAYRRYAQSPSIFSAEAGAQQARRGLWADPSPTPPWAWRRAGR